MSTTIQTDDDNSVFLTSSFATLLEEMESRKATYFTLTRDDGGVLALLTTNSELIKYVEAAIEAYVDAVSEEDGHDAE